MVAKVYALIFITVQRQKQRMGSNEGVAKILPSTLQPSKSHVIRENLLTFSQNAVKE